MATSDVVRKKKSLKNFTDPRVVQDYIETLKTQLAEEQEQKEALSLERAKLKVCWEMTLEELASTRTELTEKINSLESELEKQAKRRKLLQNLLHDYERNMEEMRSAIESIAQRPKCVQDPDRTMAEQ